MNYQVYNQNPKYNKPKKVNLDYCVLNENELTITHTQKYNGFYYHYLYSLGLDILYIESPLNQLETIEYLVEMGYKVTINPNANFNWE